jgi:hypothetical protein
MGRLINSSVTSSNLTTEFTDSSSTFDADGYLTSYVANNISYASIAYADENGDAASYGGVYKTITGWIETNTINNRTQTITVNYDGTTGRVSSLSIT